MVSNVNNVVVLAREYKSSSLVELLGLELSERGNFDVVDVSEQVAPRAAPTLLELKAIAGIKPGEAVHSIIWKPAMNPLDKAEKWFNQLFHETGVTPNLVLLYTTAGTGVHFMISR